MTQCKNCEFWANYGYPNGVGECHRNAPSPHLQIGTDYGLDGKIALAVWPITYANAGCGEGKQEEVKNVSDSKTV